MTDSLADAIAETISTHPDQVERWRSNEPGAWGFLAGRGVLAYRSKLGRSLTEGERRKVWAALWAELERRREAPTKDNHPWK